MVLFISPPFGNYLNFPKTIPIRGSFTLYPRKGRFRQIIKTLRYDFGYGCWINKIGLRNPGIDSAIKSWKKGEIISIAILDKSEVDMLLNKVPENMDIELNISCPNTEHEMNRFGIEKFLNNKRDWCIIKLGPIETITTIDKLYNMGFRQFHCSNTVPTKNIPNVDYDGGMSGKVLIPYTTDLVKQISEKYSDVEIIAGGGIQNIETLNQYKRLGAHHFSISSLCFHPIKFVKFYYNWYFNDWYVVQ